mmetsp:Transcript_66392/g.209915  ORF Transcript_66392/g.209915 Transcript_66392/m.209915 type:complete len:216 (-) Transcript_66392:342-989(-)
MGSRKEVGDAAHVHLRDDGVLGAQEELLGCHSAEGEARLQAIVQAEEDVRVEAVSHHADALAVRDAVLLLEVIDHEGAWLAHDCGLLARAAPDGAHHGAVAGPLLGVGEVRDLIEVGGDKLATFVLVDAQLSVLDLVVVYVAVEADDDRTHFGVVLHLPAGAHEWLLLAVGLRAKPRDADKVQLLADALLTYDVHLLARLTEPRLLQIGSRREGR